MLLFFVQNTALSPLEQQRHTANLPLHLKSLTAQNFYCISIKSDTLTSTMQHEIETILTAEYVTELGQLPAQLYVTPRVGTISPWSSKATDILQQCGLVIERIEHGVLFHWQVISPGELNEITESELLHDPMTQSVHSNATGLELLFKSHSAIPLSVIPLQSEGIEALFNANQRLGLALSHNEMLYLQSMYQELLRNPTDVELMMFAQANSEHCRHKIFNAEFTYNTVKDDESLFKKIKYTYNCHSDNTLSAYSDNSAVICGHIADFWHRDKSHDYSFSREPIHILMKVETHNHPTAISPYAGAATGSGGELRDEGATGRGGRPKAGMTGFCVSDLLIPDLNQPWENAIGKPAHMCSALQIMLEAPIGSASYNNEFGRPNIAGFFRSYTQQVSGHYRGYHKPIMLAGGYGNIRNDHVHKQRIPVAAKLIVLGGPAMEIGLGGGAASSKTSQEADAKLDFASVQRDNPEMQRRCQEVIDYCLSLGKDNPIVSIHDVGAGGLSNAFPELIHDAERGGQFELRKIPNAEPGMSPLAIWCNEAQERYVIGIEEINVELFDAIAKRERCPYAIAGVAIENQQLMIHDEKFSNQPVSLPLPKLLGSMPRMKRTASTFQSLGVPFDHRSIELHQAIQQVLQLPSVASKQFLITIGDRSIGGHVVRDQMVGPWQVPVSDVAVTTSSYTAFCGEAMAIGERTPLALLNPAASARMAVGEMITNIAAADIAKLSDIKLSANWMAACGTEQEDGALYEAVEAIAKEFCPSLGLTIPVGKDSLSMQTRWKNSNDETLVKSPMSLTITGFAPVTDVRKTLTPELRHTDSLIFFIDLATGNQRLGGSALLQTYKQLGIDAPDIDDPKRLIDFFVTMQQLKQQNLISAYHDRSDGGLFSTLAEMTFASHIGWKINIEHLGEDPLAILFNEELGAVVEITENNKDEFMAVLAKNNLKPYVYCLGHTVNNDVLEVNHQNKKIINEKRSELQRTWSNVSYHMQKLRDNPVCAVQEFKTIDSEKPKLFSKLNFTPAQHSERTEFKPKIAILREQGVNGHLEMAAAFHLAGFAVIDVHMTDIINGNEDLSSMSGLVACGGFSYGDVLGAGRGWASAILHNKKVKNIFEIFFNRKDTFTLGVCNGCQMLSYLRDLIPGASHLPTFIHNQSAQFEARLSMVEITESKSLFFKDMAGSQLPITVAHGEGQAQSENDFSHIAMQYIDETGAATESYPANPNGSPKGITGITSEDGRVTIMMPHPERIFRTVQASWHPKDWQEMSPWFTMFKNAYQWIEEHCNV